MKKEFEKVRRQRCKSKKEETIWEEREESDCSIETRELTRTVIFSSSVEETFSSIIRIVKLLRSTLFKSTESFYWKM